ncbi:MAG: hypothetical protein AAGA75_09115 [Cyanobacteria bacterium P01_E01_bin.6]
MSTSKSASENLQYYFGDHWPFWVGPIVPQSVSGAAEKMAALKRVFQSANIIGECVDNWKDGLISQDFTWYLKGETGDRLDTEGNTTAAAAEIELQRWIDFAEQMTIQGDPTLSQFKCSDPWSEFVLSLGVTGKAAFRLWQPEKFANDDDPIKRIHLHVPKAPSVSVERDDDGFLEEIRYSYTGDQEVHRQDEQGRMVVTVGDEEMPPIDTGDRWLIQCMECESLLTPQVKALQNAINHSLTMKLRNNELSGFREKVFLNAEFPDADMERGPGRDVYLYGILQGDRNSPTYANPSVVESQPVPITTFRESIELDRVLMYLHFRQGHLLSNDGNNISGESRIQMRAGFELYLKGWKRRVESAISNVLNIVLKLLGHEGFEVVVELRISTGKLSNEERQSVIGEFNAGLLSRSTAIATLGTVADTDAEIALIEEERSEQSAPIAADPLEVDEDDDDDDNDNDDDDDGNPNPVNPQQ